MGKEKVFMITDENDQEKERIYQTENLKIELSGQINFLNAELENHLKKLVEEIQGQTNKTFEEREKTMISLRRFVKWWGLLILPVMFSVKILPSTILTTLGSLFFIFAVLTFSAIEITALIVLYHILKLDKEE